MSPLAIGLAFLIAPSGWLVRLVSPLLTGWDRPPVRPRHGARPAGPGDGAGPGAEGGAVPDADDRRGAAAGARTRRCAAAPRRSATGRPPAWFKVVFPPRLRAASPAGLRGAGVLDVDRRGRPDPRARASRRRWPCWPRAGSPTTTCSAIFRRRPPPCCRALSCSPASSAGDSPNPGRAPRSTLVRNRPARRGDRAAARVRPGDGGALAALLGLASLLGMVVWSAAETWRFPAARSRAAGASRPGRPSGRAGRGRRGDAR